MRFLVPHRSVLIQATAFAIVAAAVTAPALATVGGGSGATGTPQVSMNALSTIINGVIDFATGPMAKFAAVCAIVAGAVMFMQGRETGENLQKIGVIVLAVGLLTGIVGWIGNINGATI